LKCQLLKIKKKVVIFKKNIRAFITIILSFPPVDFIKNASSQKILSFLLYTLLSSLMPLPTIACRENRTTT
jgi:hypothetical protein